MPKLVQDMDTNRTSTGEDRGLHTRGSGCIQRNSNLDRDPGSDPGMGSTDIFEFNCELLIIVTHTSAEIIGAVAQFQEEDRPSMIATVRLAMPEEL